MSLLCFTVFVGEHGTAGKNHALTSEEKQCARKTKTDSEFPAEVAVHGR